MRLALPFAAQHRGKRRGALAQLVLDCARHAGPPYSFRQLLDALEDAAAAYGTDDKGIDGVNRVRETVRICPARQGLPGCSIRHASTASDRRKNNFEGGRIAPPLNRECGEF
ncbi:MAG: hypothetical protein M5R42_20430 [Rhodocyclaceae bacterium]|nr:hypothetical protein [Rhodocyclaceae bacterium]